MKHKEILSKFNIPALNTMQEKAIAAIDGEKDVILISPTGSGKTLAFLLPLVSKMNDQENIQALIIVPSRELAIQIEKVFRQMGTGFKINSCYGGHPFRTEENNLKHPPSVLLGTPGRLGHHIRRGTIETKFIKTLILDEFDKSLEFGFQKEMEFIIGKCKGITKRVLTSATEPEEIPSFTGMDHPQILNFSTGNEESKSSLTLKYVRVPGDDKTDALLLLLGKIGKGPGIVFCNHREAVERISEQLSLYKVEHESYHGKMEQPDRERAIIKLRNGSSQILITTDLAARGLDIPEIQFIVHYQLPLTSDIMVHRNGRTARMHASGTAYFLLDKNDHLPKFLERKPDEERLPSKFIIPAQSKWKTLYFSAGKKEKINKIDIAGMLMQKGHLGKEELGKIEVLDHSAYAAVQSDKIAKVLKLVKDEKIKNKKIKIEIAN